MSEAPRRAAFVDRLSRRILPRLVRYTNRAGSALTTLHQRPRAACGYGSWPDPDIDHRRMAIVMQGPISSGFTLETLKLYARHMPGCDIILSTWADTPEHVLAPIRALGVRVVLSEKPAIAGLFNVNMQITSAAAGVRAAVAAGALWVLKTRVDQRLGDRNALAFLKGMAQAFPPAAGTGQTARIIGVGHGSLKFVPYHLTDQTVFGSARDMLAYWTPLLREGAAPDHWPVTSADIFAQLPIGEIARHGAAETYLASCFLQHMGHETVWTVADSWAAFRDRFCFIDPAMVDFCWEKEQANSLAEHMRRYDMISNRYEMGFGEWLLLHSGQIPATAGARYEGMLRTRFHAPVPEPD